MLELDARYEWWGMLPNMHHSLFLISHFHKYSALRHITWKLQVIHVCRSLAYWTTAILPETFFVWFRVTLEIKLESYMYGLRHASVVLIWHCVHILQVCTHVYTVHVHCYSVHNYACQQNSRTLWLHKCTTHQTVALLLTMHRFIRTKLAIYMTHCNFN